MKRNLLLLAGIVYASFLYAMNISSPDGNVKVLFELKDSGVPA